MKAFEIVFNVLFFATLVFWTLAPSHAATIAVMGFAAGKIVLTAIDRLKSRGRSTPS